MARVLVVPLSMASRNPGIARLPSVSTALWRDEGDFQYSPTPSSRCRIATVSSGTIDEYRRRALREATNPSNESARDSRDFAREKKFTPK
jgi:hypothetical protein